MSRILEQIELSEGDLVLTFNKTIDIMRQAREMLAQVMPDHVLRDQLERAEALIRRDIVEQSLSAGFVPLVEFSTDTDEIIIQDPADFLSEPDDEDEHSSEHPA
jgi:ATP-dependent RNA helicase HelY